ncbi:hypothetical protein PCANB_000044 [Pneumocystis canis]|nr:hypothetical protein PCK1_000142 [Pneumocystis canis]KAG5439762.1 hypothetical protein PCANB_000044 [Pneumocystis canis]
MQHAPAIITKLFDLFPWIRYASLDIRSPIDTTRHQLFIAHKDDTLLNSPSYDLESLRWQTYFILADIPHNVFRASPHASPSGTLPFFVPAGVASSAYALSSTAFQTWLTQHGIELHPFINQPSLAADADSYLSLIENTLYDAWFCACFIERENFQTVTGPCYVNDVWPIRELIKWQLCRKIKKRLSDRQKTGLLNLNEIYADAAHALDAVAIRLGEDIWFFGAKNPTFIDATLFAYTYLVLSTQLPGNTLMHALKKHTNLIDHATRLWKYCYMDK